MVKKFFSIHKHKMSVFLIYLLDLATLSNSSFFLIAKLFDEPLAAFISSSAKHSAIVLMFLNAAFLAPVHNNQMAWLTRLVGEISQACRLTDPALPILVESSLGPLLRMAFVITWMGFSPVSKWMISKVWRTILMVSNFLPLFLPCIIKELVSRSTIGHCAFRKRTLL